MSFWFVCGGVYVAIVHMGLYSILRTLLFGRGLYIVHETGRRRWFGLLSMSYEIATFTGGGLLRWQVKSGS